MTKYLRRVVEVDAFRFNNESLTQLPDWLKSHTGNTAYGVQQVGRDAVGALLVPTKAGKIETVHTGDYVVHYGNGEIECFRSAAFEEAFVQAPSEASEPSAVSSSEPTTQASDEPA
jgi:hypothetical protein